MLTHLSIAPCLGAALQLTKWGMKVLRATTAATVQSISLAYPDIVGFSTTHLLES